MFRTIATLISLVAAPAAGAGTLTAETFRSPALHRDMAANVYIPDGEAPPNGWPVLYLLHGHGGDQNSWRDLGNVEATLDRIIASGRVQPLVVIMPDGDDSWYVDSASVGGPGDYDTALTRDLRLGVEARYPVRKDREGRAIAGLSMGGYGALRLAYSHNELYVAVASLSGAIWQNVDGPNLDKDPEQLRVVQEAEYFDMKDRWAMNANIILPSTGDHFHGAFGRPFDARRFNQLNVFSLIRDAVAANEPLPVTFISCGDDDSYRLWRGAVELHETLDATKHTSELRITDGGHVWSLWEVTLVDALNFINRQWLPTAYPQPAVPAPVP